MYILKLNDKFLTFIKNTFKFSDNINFAYTFENIDDAKKYQINYKDSEILLLKDYYKNILDN